MIKHSLAADPLFPHRVCQLRAQATTPAFSHISYVPSRANLLMMTNEVSDVHVNPVKDFIAHKPLPLARIGGGPESGRQAPRVKTAVLPCRASCLPDRLGCLQLHVYEVSNRVRLSDRSAEASSGIKKLHLSP